MAELVMEFVNELTSQQTVAILLVVVIVLLAGGSLWLAWLMRGKRRQAEALRVERQALLENQLAALQRMREAGQQPPEDTPQQAQPEK
jgi:cell division protein FtsL